MTPAQKRAEAIRTALVRRLRRSAVGDRIPDCQSVGRACGISHVAAHRHIQVAIDRAGILVSRARHNALIIAGRLP